MQYFLQFFLSINYNNNYSDKLQSQGQSSHCPFGIAQYSYIHLHRSRQKLLHIHMHVYIGRHVHTAVSSLYGLPIPTHNRRKGVVCTHAQRVTLGVRVRAGGAPILLFDAEHCACAVVSHLCTCVLLTPISSLLFYWSHISIYIVMVRNDGSCNTS